MFTSVYVLCGEVGVLLLEKKIVRFKDGVGVLAADLEKVHKSHYIDIVYVEEGIHSYRTCEAAVASNYGTVFYAIIPKGSEYYIGTNKEIVASKMLIFEDKVAFDNYKEK